MHYKSYGFQYKSSKKDQSSQIIHSSQLLCFFWLDINQYQFISVIPIRNEFILVMNDYNVSMACIKYTCCIHYKSFWHYLHKSDTLLPIHVNITHILDNNGPIHSKLYSVNYEVIQTSQILIHNPFIEIQKYHISIS
jgi:hypothetical protein